MYLYRQAIPLPRTVCKELLIDRYILNSTKNNDLDVTFRGRCALYRRQEKQTETTLKTTTEQYTNLVLSAKDTLYRLALSITGSDVEAEDIVQDIYEKAWRARDAVLASHYPRAYLCRMARNLAIDRLRMRKVTVEIADREVEDGIKGVVINDIAQYTVKVISALPEKQRVAIQMRDVEGYELEEIAEVLECDQTSVRMNLSRARKSVREQILKAMNYGTE